MEEVARNCYLDTPWDSPASSRYIAQLNERTALKHMIADEPAANVREDIQGEWEIIEYEFFTCSVCGNSYYNGAESTAQAESYLNSGNVYNFCPHCGARMK